MSEDKKPKKYDVVLGGNNTPPVDGLVLGGIEGIKRQFAKTESDRDRFTILKDALQYGEAGEDWLFEVLSKETGEIQWCAAVLLSEIANKPYKRYFYNPIEKTKSDRIIGLIKKDGDRFIKKRDDLEYILEFVPSEKEKVLVEYFKNIIINCREQWNTWRIKYSDYMLYLREIDLSNCNLQKINLSHVNLVNANLKAANLYKADLTRSGLCYANFNTSHLHTSILKEVDFRKANLEKATLTSRETINSHFGEANLREASCGGCFTGSSFSSANFSNASLIYSDLRDVIIDKTNFYGANFRRADISGLDFKGLDIREANFARSTRTKTNFKGANFKGAHFNDDYYEPGWE